MATLLGLLLVVTMLANYLSTQLPGQMQLNDANHALQVENQVARFGSALRAAASIPTIGALLSQPISLGSSGAPPFAPADGAAIGPGISGSALTTSFTATGPKAYTPPKVGAAGGPHYAFCTVQTATALTCTATSRAVWNFSASSSALTATITGGPYYVNATAANTTITVTASASVTLYLIVVGSNDTVSLTMSASGNAVHVEMVGNHDTVSTASGTFTSSVLTAYFVGRYDTLSSSTLTPTSSRIFVTAFGSYDNTSFGTVTATSSYINVYLNGFVPSSPTPGCPVGNLAYTTDSVAVSSHTGGTYNVTFNDTTVTTGSAPSPWTATFGTPSISCPFYVAAVVPQKSSGAVGATFIVALRNTYSPWAEVAFDQGAVVYAQMNGVPLILVGPAISYVAGNLTLWVPVFVGRIGTEVGTGVAGLSARLTSVLNVTLPSGGFNVTGTTSIAVTTPFAAAWFNYLDRFSALAGDVACVPKTGAVCTGPFSASGALGTVYLNVTATALDLEVATYSIALT